MGRPLGKLLHCCLKAMATAMENARRQATVQSRSPKYRASSCITELRTGVGRHRLGGSPVCRSVGLSICQSTGPLVEPSACLSVYQSVGLSVCRSAGLSVCRSVSVLVRRFADLPVFWSNSLPVCLSAGPTVSLPVCRLPVYWSVGLLVRGSAGP